MWIPENDGIDHINVYSKGKTWVGRQLTNFSHNPFAVPGEGNFASLEAYWYWRRSGMVHDVLRPLWGYKAKKAGKEFSVVHDPNFHDAICNAHQWRLRCNPMLAYSLKQTSLPLAHYYVYGDENYKIVPVKEHEWQIAHLEYLRFCLQWS